MKKIFIIVLLFICIFSYNVVFAEDTIKISSIDIEDISDNTLINKEPQVNGLSFSSDATFFEVNDFIKYKITVNNPTPEDYILSNDTKFSDNNYIKYKYEVDGDSIIKSNSTKTMFITVSYNKEIEESNYEYKNNMALNLTNLNNNPKTGSSNKVLTIVSILMIVFGMYMVMKYGKKENLIVLIICLSILPLGVFAIETLKINIESNIVIEKEAPTFKICAHNINPESCTTYRYKEGMIWNKWLTSKYNYNQLTFENDGSICNYGSRYLMHYVENDDSFIEQSVKYTDLVESKTYYTGIGVYCA